MKLSTDIISGCVLILYSKTEQISSTPGTVRPLKIQLTKVGTFFYDTVYYK